MSKKLHQELRKQHASKQEIAKLGDIADMLAVVNPPGLSPAARQRIASRLPVDVDIEQPKKRYVLQWTLAGLAGAFAVLFVLMTSLVQSALPDPTVYNLKDKEGKNSRVHSESKTPLTQQDSPKIQQLQSDTELKSDTPAKDTRRDGDSTKGTDRQSKNDRDMKQSWSDRYKSWLREENWWRRD